MPRRSRPEMFLQLGNTPLVPLGHLSLSFTSGLQFGGAPIIPEGHFGFTIDLQLGGVPVSAGWAFRLLDRLAIRRRAGGAGWAWLLRRLDAAFAGPQPALLAALVGRACRIDAALAVPDLPFLRHSSAGLVGSTQRPSCALVAVCRRTYRCRRDLVWTGFALRLRLTQRPFLSRS